MTYEVTLMRKSTFEGKRVVVEARNSDQAFSKAKSMQHRCGGPSAWAEMTAKIMGMESSKVAYKPKGVRYNR